MLSVIHDAEIRLQNIVQHQTLAQHNFSGGEGESENHPTGENKTRGSIFSKTDLSEEKNPKSCLQAEKEIGGGNQGK